MPAIGAMLAIAIPLLLGLASGSAMAQRATLLPAFRGGVRPDVILKDPQAIISISSACYASISGNVGNAAKRCIIDKLQAMGASAQALAFADYAPVPSAIEYYQRYRNAASVYAVMRWADGASGWCLIGRSGEAIGMWEPTGAEGGAKFVAFAKTHPGAMLWMPVDKNDAPSVLALEHGGERLVMPFTIKTCHACAVIGNARIGFDFDQAGRYRGAHLLNITSATPTSR